MHYKIISQCKHFIKRLTNCCLPLKLSYFNRIVSTTHSVDMLHYWHAAVDKGQSLCTVFVDFRPHQPQRHCLHVGWAGSAWRYRAVDLCLHVRPTTACEDWPLPVGLAAAGSWKDLFSAHWHSSSWSTHCDLAVWLISTLTTQRWSRYWAYQQSFVDKLVQQATVIVNGCKTKEMLIGSVLKDPQLSVTLSGTRQHIEAAGSSCCEWFEVDAACWRHLIQRLITTLLPAAAEMIRRRPRRHAVRLHHSHTTSARICMFGVALQPHSCTDQVTGVTTADGDEDHLPRQWLYAVTDQS